MSIGPPPGHPSEFRATVHGIVFGHRVDHLAGLAARDPLLLIPDPPDTDEPGVWVHVPAGDPVGHLPPEIGRWLAPWLLRGGSASAVVVRVGGADSPSWKRLLVEIRVGQGR